MFLFDWFYGILTSLGLRQKEANIMFLGLDNACKMELLSDLKEISSTPANLGSLRFYVFIYFFSYLFYLFYFIYFFYYLLLLLLCCYYYSPNQRLVANQRFVQYPPMQYSTSEELSIGKIKFKVFDLGGHQIARRVWRDYNAKVDAVVYVVKAHDLEWFAESRRELEALLSYESLANVPFLILADVSFYRNSEDLLLSLLGLTNFTTGKGKVNLGDTNVRPLEVFMYNFLQGHSQYIDGFKWLSQYIK